MDVTASRDAETPLAAYPVRLFLTARPARAVAVVAVLLGAVAAWFGTVETPVPTSVEQGRAGVPLWRMLAMGVAVLPVLGLTSPLADLELVATGRLRAMQRRYLALLSLGSAATYLGCCAIVMPPPVLAVMARSWLAWFGLALLAGVLLGWRLAWVLPSAVAVVLWYWGYQGGDRYRWWEFSARPPDDLPSLLLSAALLAAGLVAYAATPWRRRAWLAWRW